jgi:hypothetical protein
MNIYDDWFMAIIAAIRLSHAEKLPCFVYRPAVPRPRPVITFDEEKAARECDADGYRRCDAAEALDDD